MKDDPRILDTDEAWDGGALGRDDSYVQVADETETAGIDEALGLQPISIRLERSLIEDFKLIAQLNGLGYQPLMRQALRRFADCEKKRILRDLAIQQAQDNAQQIADAGAKPGRAPTRKKAA